MWLAKRAVHQVNVLCKVQAGASERKTPIRKARPASDGAPGCTRAQSKPEPEPAQEPARLAGLQGPRNGGRVTATSASRRHGALKPEDAHRKKVRRDAKVSPDRRYRYWLQRRWAEGPVGVVVGINPSTADADAEDHTTRKLIGFAERWGWGGYWLVNPFALRATDQRELLRAEDPVGPENDDELLAAFARGALTADEYLVPAVVCAWGSAKTVAIRRLLDRRLEQLWALLSGAGLATRAWSCLGTSRDGSPRHPLMLAYDTPLVPFAWPEVRS